MAFNSAKNILVGASPLYISTSDSTVSGYKENLLDRATGGISFTARTKAAVALDASSDVRNVGFTNNGLQITYNPTYDSVTVDQLLFQFRRADPIFVSNGAVKFSGQDLKTLINPLVHARCALQFADHIRRIIRLGEVFRHS